jgi:hypothetical protein
MADQVETFRSLVGDDRELAVLVDHVRRVDERAVDLGAERGLGETRANRGRHVCHGDRLVELTD